MQPRNILDNLLRQIGDANPDGVAGEPDVVRTTLQEMWNLSPRQTECELLLGLGSATQASVGSFVLALDFLASRRGTLDDATITALERFIEPSSPPQMREDACSALAGIRPYNVAAPSRSRLGTLFRELLHNSSTSLSRRAAQLVDRAAEEYARFDAVLDAVERGSVVLKESTLAEILDPLTLDGKAFALMGYHVAEPERFRNALAFSLVRPDRIEELNPFEERAPVRMHSRQLIGPTGHQAVVHTLWRESVQQERQELIWAAYRSRVRLSSNERLDQIVI